MRKTIVTLLLIMNFLIVFGQEMNKENVEVVSDFIHKIRDKDKLAEMVSYPLARQYPLAEIKNKQEFINRYNEVFDDSLISMIVNSKPSVDWSRAGWRGIMLFNGELWLNELGELTHVTHLSNFERKKREELIRIEKSTLHESIKEFKQPIHILESNKYRVRIDDLGEGNYRYTSWLLKNKMNDKPDLILRNGKLIPEGSGGNHRYEFKNGNYKYECSIILIGEDNSPPAVLTVYKGDKEIWSDKAKIVRK